MYVYVYIYIYIYIYMAVSESAHQLCSRLFRAGFVLYYVKSLVWVMCSFWFVLWRASACLMCRIWSVLSADLCSVQALQALFCVMCRLWCVCVCVLCAGFSLCCVRNLVCVMWSSVCAMCSL